MSENNSDFGAFLAGFVIGGLVGAATALILAPQSGEQMRDQIANKGQELRQIGEERVQHYRELADSYAEEYKHKADEVVADARERIAQTSETIQEQARIILEPGKERNNQEPDEETAVA